MNKPSFGASGISASGTGASDTGASGTGASGTCASGTVASPVQDSSETVRLSPRTLFCPPKSPGE